MPTAILRMRRSRYPGTARTDARGRGRRGTPRATTAAAVLLLAGSPGYAASPESTPAAAGAAIRAASPAAAATVGAPARAAAVAPAAAPEPSASAPLAPTIESIRVVRTGTRSRFSVSFRGVQGAAGYDLQVAKTLVFSRLLLDSRCERSPARELGLPPGVYFVRLRAVMPAGPGPFSKVEVLDTTGTSDHAVASRAASTPATGAAGAGSTPAMSQTDTWDGGKDPNQEPAAPVARERELPPEVKATCQRLRDELRRAVATWDELRGLLDPLEARVASEPPSPRRAELEAQLGELMAARRIIEAEVETLTSDLEALAR